MYNCQNCGRTSKERETINRVVLETRERTYTMDVKNIRTRQTETIVVGHGSEIVRETQVCNECREQLEGPPAQQAA